MSAFKTVFDFLKDVPKNMNHEELYLDKVRHASLYGTKTDISMVEWEASVVGLAENNILSGLVMDNKFTLNGMVDKLPIATFALAKQKDDPEGQSSKKNKATYTKKFSTDRKKYLPAAEGRVLYPERPGVCIERDNVLKGRLQSAMPNLSGQEMGDIILLTLGEKMNIPTDMRHIFAKGYLLLCDYNLAAASRYKKRAIKSDWGVSAKHNITSVQRMMLMSVSDLVVDADVFTPSERSLLSLMCASYPTVKYAGDNVYNSIRMKEDPIIWVSEGQVTVNKEYSFGSPDRMYHDMMEIANKMGCLEDMRTVFRDMRGLPFLLDKISEYSGRTEYPLKYPKSYCMRNALGERDNWTTHITARTNYMSTTKALIAELLLGEALAFGLYTVSEQLGAYGRVGCLTGDHDSDPVFNSNCRDYGLKHEDERVNRVMQEWRAAKNCSIIVGFRGSIKKALISMAGAIHRKEIKVSDFSIPQVGFELPFSTCKNTSWATIKGYNPKIKRRADGFGEVKMNAEGQAFKFMMGVRTAVPLVGYNSVGARMNEVQSLAEVEFDAGGGGEYRIVAMDYYINCETTPRVDEMEVTALGVHYTRFKGTRCSVIVDGVGEEFVAKEIERMPESGETMGKVIIDGDKTEDGFETVLTPGGGPLKDKASKLLKKLNFASIAREDRLRVRPMKTFAIDATGRKMVDVAAVGELRYLQPKNTSGLNEGVYKITREQTSGEGLLCGLRAIGQDLVRHGLLPKNELETFITHKQNDLVSVGNYNVEELALAMNQVGLGLTVMTPHTGGGFRAMNYGTKDSLHNIVLYNDGGNHYENVILNGDEMVKVVTSNEGQTPADTARRIADFGYFVVNV